METKCYDFDFVVVGAGLSGMAAAVQAAHNGLKVALINDRPCLGGNASKEIQTPPIGAHSMGSNYAYHRETGLLEELLLENLNNNPQGNIELWGMNLESFIYREKNITVFLNTIINRVYMSEDGKSIEAVGGYNMEDEVFVKFSASLFSDCSGNGTVGYLSGAPFMRGCEEQETFGEPLAKKFNDEMSGEYGLKREMGCSLRFRAKNTGRETVFKKPDWVKYNFTDEDLKNRSIETLFMASKGGFWWLEWGGFMDTVKEASVIRREVTEIVYGVWDYLKNRSKIRDEIKTYELDWVGTVLGRRENRRFCGDYILAQTDMDNVVDYEDNVAYGGWGYDDHAPKGFFDSDIASLFYLHIAPYNIPLRCLYSKTVENLFFAGRNISVSHVALSSTRVMCTCFQLGEAVGAAAVVCSKNGILPRQAAGKPYIEKVQKILTKSDHTILGVHFSDEKNIAPHAAVTVSSELKSPVVPGITEWHRLDCIRCVQFPVVTQNLESLTIILNVDEDTELSYKLYSGYRDHRRISNMPHEVIYQNTVQLKKGEHQSVTLPVSLAIEKTGWFFLALDVNNSVSIAFGDYASVGLKSLTAEIFDSMGEDFATFLANNEWTCITDILREPSYCVEISPAQSVYSAKNLISGVDRPTVLPNLWISEETDFSIPEFIELEWEKPQHISEIQIVFDSGLSGLLSSFSADGNCKIGGYEGNRIPSIIKKYRVLAQKAEGEWQCLAEVEDNYHRLCSHPAYCDGVKKVRIELCASNGTNRAQVYAVRVLK